MGGRNEVRGVLGRGEGGGRSSGFFVLSAEECLAGICGIVGEYLDAFVVGEAGVI